MKTLVDSTEFRNRGGGALLQAKRVRLENNQSQLLNSYQQATRAFSDKATFHYKLGPNGKRDSSSLALLGMTKAGRGAEGQEADDAEDYQLR